LVGSPVRPDCINQLGPPDAWVNLTTVTLTNTTQLYFDASAIGQRLGFGGRATKLHYSTPLDEDVGASTKPVSTAGKGARHISGLAPFR